MTDYEIHDHDHEEHDDHEGHDHDHHDHVIPDLAPAEHRQQGAALFNRVWEYLDAADRDAAADDQMVHAAHASRWHWSQAGDAGGPEQLAVGEWQCSRVYAVLRRTEPALHHARASLQICAEAGLGDWVLAAAHEAMARASALAGAPDAAEWLAKARSATAKIAEREDRDVIEADLATIPA